MAADSEAQPAYGDTVSPSRQAVDVAVALTARVRTNHGSSPTNGQPGGPIQAERPLLTVPAAQLCIHESVRSRESPPGGLEDPEAFFRERGFTLSCHESDGEWWADRHKFNKVEDSWTVTPGACSAELDLESGTTHERGHTFGFR
jgi:hypothetical protein